CSWCFSPFEMVCRVRAVMACGPWSVLPLRMTEREAAAQRRPARSERENVLFCETTDWFETQSASN
ncbi:hypothetical protein QUW15_12345, partial [Desulfovibrio piger]|nr:hypothetical protein [Desulfovibrio piger]